ncbi:MAG: hypothetical protein ACK53Y_10975, partial [bacterium]
AYPIEWDTHTHHAALPVLRRVLSRPATSGFICVISKLLTLKDAHLRNYHPPRYLLNRVACP